MNRASKQQGMSIIKVIALIPAVLIGLVVLVFIYTELNKAYWDYRVKQMCEKDGGVTVYEKVSISQEEAKSLGRVGANFAISPKVEFRKNDVLFTKDNNSMLKEGGLEVIKIERLVFSGMRRS